MQGSIPKEDTKANTEGNSQIMFLLRSRRDITATDTLIKMQRMETHIIEDTTEFKEDISSWQRFVYHVKIGYDKKGDYIFKQLV